MFVRPAGFLVGWLLAILYLAVVGPPSSAHAHEIAILKSSDLAPYNQAIEGFKAVATPGSTYTEYDLQGDLEHGRKLARKIRASEADLVLAVGLKAALAAKLEIIDTPIIFCMVLDPSKAELKAPNMTGILLEVPIDRQLAGIRSVLPSLKRLGVLYDPAKTSALVDESRRQAKSMGLEVSAQPISSARDVPSTLRAILPQVDALWLIPDSTVLTEDSIKFLLVAALEQNVPVVGFSSEFVRSGALLGLSVSYQDVGRQAGFLADKILRGRAPISQAALPPEHVRLTLNLKTAKYLGLSIPQAIVEKADETY
jgi:putative ABC transport system substrate-binding protein